MLALVIVEWAVYARTARGTALVERRKEYIEAAEALAIPRWRVLFTHLLPNCLPPLIVIATVQVARAIALEATLSFLGLGVPVTEPSLGLLVANGYQYMLSARTGSASIREGAAGDYRRDQSGSAIACATCSIPRTGHEHAGHDIEPRRSSTIISVEDLHTTFVTEAVP